MAIRRQAISILLVVSALGVAACGSGGDGEAASTTTEPDSVAPESSITATTDAPLTTMQDIETLVVSAACEDRWDATQRMFTALSAGNPKIFERVARSSYQQLAETCPTPEEWIKAAFTHGAVLGLDDQAVLADFLLQMEFVCGVVGDKGMCPAARAQGFIDGHA